MRTVVGVFSDRAQADHVVQHLIQIGVPSDDVAVADSVKAEGHEWSQRNLAACGGMAPGWFMAWLVPLLAKRTFPSAVAFGAGIGGAVGFLAGVIAIGAGTPFGTPLTVFTGIGTGAIFGGLIAGMYSLGVTHEEIPLQAEAVREHGVVVAAHVEKANAEETYRVMEEHGARALRAGENAWNASGWEGDRIPDEPYPSDSTFRKHAA